MKNSFYIAAQVEILYLVTHMIKNNIKNLISSLFYKIKKYFKILNSVLYNTFEDKFHENEAL